MMTVVTTLKLEPEAEPEWDGLIRERFRSAHSCEGWVSGELLAPVDEPHTRVIVGTWRRREDWEAWHHDPDFLATRSRLDALQPEAQQTVWYDVIEDTRARTD